MDGEGRWWFCLRHMTAGPDAGCPDGGPARLLPGGGRGGVRWTLLGGGTRNGTPATADGHI